MERASQAEFVLRGSHRKNGIDSPLPGRKPAEGCRFDCVSNFILADHPGILPVYRDCGRIRRLLAACSIT